MARTGYGSGKRCSCTIVNSPVGKLTLVATAEGLAGILWENERPGRVRLNVEVEDASHPVLVETERQLSEYFAGQRTAFAVVLDFAGTAFQRKVWNALLTIPFGETRSYRQIATQIGHPDAVRAVGAANGRNPVSIIVPCHRVVGTNGRLTGFAGGLDAKAYLLALEATKPMTLLDVSDGAGGGLVVAGNQARRNRQAIPRIDRRDRQRQIRELPVVEVRADVGVHRV